MEDAEVFALEILECGGRELALRGFRHQLHNRLRQNDAARARAVALRSRQIFETPPYQEVAALFVSKPHRFHRPGHVFLAHQAKRCMFPEHVERLPPNFVRGVLRHLQLEFRRGERGLFNDIENDERERIVCACSILVRSAEIHRVPPIVVDRAKLPEEVTKLLPELRLCRPPRRKVRLVIRPPAHINIVERPHLEVVERLGKDEVHHRELHYVKHCLGRPDAQALKRGDLLLQPFSPRRRRALARDFLQFPPGLGDQAVEEAHHRSGGAFLCAVERRIPRV